MNSQQQSRTTGPGLRRRLPRRLGCFFVALTITLGVALPSAASSGTMSCGSGGTPRTTGYGGGLQYHWVQGSAGTWYQASGTLTLYWTWRSGNRAWAVNAPSGGLATCIT